MRAGRDPPDDLRDLVRQAIYDTQSPEEFARLARLEEEERAQLHALFEQAMSRGVGE